MRDYGRFIILDESILNSAYIQLFVLERYDPKVFEPVILDGAAKVYRLKR
jgi:general glycosylation pathway protein